jgi:FkbM family methyltransferase
MPGNKSPYAGEELKFFTRLASFGYQPKVIYDIGASNGGWSANINAVFPHARYELFEPLAGTFEPYARQMKENLNAAPHFRLHPIALGEADGTIDMGMTPDGFGSSVHTRESLNMSKVRVPIRRLDSYAAEHRLHPPDIIKIDVQASEDAILRGCGELLASAGVLHLETWLRRCYGPRTPLLTELVEWLLPRGFVLVNFGDEYYSNHHELISVDAFFCSRQLMESIRGASKDWSW